MFTDWLTLSWTSLLVRGVVGVLFGIVAMVWPDATVLVLVVLWGCWALVDGVMAIGSVGVVQGTGAKIALVVLGVLSLVAAFFALVRPGLAAVTLTWFLGIWLLVRGLFEIFGAFSSSVVMNRWVLVAGGVIDGVLGVLFMANPGAAALSIAFLIGLLALVWGLVFIGLAFVVRRTAHNLRAVPPGTAFG
jgi:uncharacterized membrane protein HdeD (DUF308 family)